MTDTWDADDEIDINLVLAEEAAARLLVLVTLARRGFLETGDDLGGESAETEQFDLIAWLREERLLDSLTPVEVEVLSTPVGSLSDEAATDATWSIESAAALAWALELLPVMPAYDAAVDATVVLDTLPAPWARTTEFRNSARLRDETEIAAALEQAEIWALRAEQYWWAQEATGEDADELTQVIASMADEAHAAGLLGAPVDGDFPTAEGPYRILPPSAVDIQELIATFRANALSWLCGLPDNQ